MLIQRIEEELDKLRPMVRGEGGDIHVIDVNVSGEVKVMVDGNCAACCVGCGVNFETAIEAALKENVPGVKKVVVIRGSAPEEPVPIQGNYGGGNPSPPGHP